MDQPVASSSRLTPPTVLSRAPTPSPSRPTRQRRRIRRATAAFVLALTAPYLAAASPLPSPRSLGHDPRPRSMMGHDPPKSPLPYNATSGGSIIGTLGALQGSIRLGEQLLNVDERDWVQLDYQHVDGQGFISVPKGIVILRQTMSPGFIVLSYLIAFVGSLCTLELLIRRTSNRGLSNIILLATAGICFGAVSTFAMHFVGNQSLTLHRPGDYPTLSLSYAGGYTVLSLVASCLAMISAFFVMGTDFRLREWRSWSCVPGHRKQRNKEAGFHNPARDDYSRWRLHKNKIRKSANVSTIFQQAGMVTSWSLMDTSNKRKVRNGWRDLLPLPMRNKFVPETEAEPYENDGGDSFDDEEAVIKRDKELWEIDFRFGRNAVREEIGRRQMLRVDSPDTDDSSSGHDSVNNVLTPQMATVLPSSPLAAYYPSNVDKPDQQVSTPSPLNGNDPLFVSGYTFPPKSVNLNSDSTTNLIPRENTWPIPMDSLSPPSHAALAVAGGRRASLPTITPLPPQRVQALTLARIQSLPEQEPDTQSLNLTPAQHDSPIQGGGSKQSSSFTGSDSSPDCPRMSFDDDEGVHQQPPGWRQSLRLKVQTGAPLSRAEKVQRFLGLDIVTWGEIAKIVVTGMVAGWGVAGMHYIGQVSIRGIPYIAYRVGYVVGSVIIASGAVIIALYIMFVMLRPKLKHSWIAKVIVAIILAGAVVGMHYIAMIGTIYGYWEDSIPEVTNSSKNAITGAVATLAFVACLGVTIFIVINSLRDRKERARRRRVVVASVLLDDQDRMLVSAIDGLLPMCDIASLTASDLPSMKKSKGARDDTNSIAGTSTLGVDLTTGNDAFVQAMKMSWSWRNPFWSSLNPFASLSDIIGQNVIEPTNSRLSGSRTAPRSLNIPRGSNATASESVVSGLNVPTRVNIARFLEKFAISATQLSVRLTGQQEGLSRLGVLYDQILTTGWVRLRNGNDTVSKGQLIFLVRRVTSAQERSDLLSRHFIFADPASVAMSLHKTLSTPLDHVMPFLEDMRGFTDSTMRMSLRANTLYAGVAVVQATPFDGLRILLSKSNRSQLPMREVCAFSTLPGLPVNVAEGLAGTLEEIGEAVTWLEGMNLLSVITRNMSQDSTKVGGPRVGRLLAALERAIIPLLDEVLDQEDMAYILPRLTLHPMLVPLTPAAPSRQGTPGWAAPHVIIFYANYDIAVNTFADKWLPFSLFRAQHECVMAGKIGILTRAAEAAAPRTPRTQSPAASPGISPGLPLDKYNYGRRPSKVQFEVPDTSGLSSYTFPATNGNGNGNANANPPLSVSPAMPLFPIPPSRDRQPPRRSSLARSVVRDEKEVGGESRAPGVAEWDAGWLVNLLRTRLRTDP